MWGHSEIKGQLAIIEGEKSPDIIITNADYLHSIYKKWMKGNIWISGDRIVYVGQAMPAVTEGAEIFDASGKKIVPGYIEPHAHPFQLYNPRTFANYAAERGTTTMISDNLAFFLTLDDITSFSIMDELSTLPFSFYWWGRFDSQTATENEATLFNVDSIRRWAGRPDVLLGGELTGWPRLMNGDPDMFSFLQAVKAEGKKIEGHFPGASERTLARMRLLGVDGDHEAMTIEEVETRLLHGYGVTLRHSSIRPDLPDLLKALVEKELDVFDHLMMTTDGSSPSFYIDGVMDKCIRIALDAGVEPIDAYQMVTYNIARYYNMTDLHGLIATGRYASLNILDDADHPVPTDVLSKGEWVKREGRLAEPFPSINWSDFGVFAPDFELKESDLRFDQPIGIEMVNDVITKPFQITRDTTAAQLENGHDESFLMLIDRHGKWHVNTVIKGFATDVQGFASTYSNTGDILLLGKDKQEMVRAFEEVKRIGGGMALVENGEIIQTLPLIIGGGFSKEPMDLLMAQELELKKALVDRGFKYGDAIFSLQFLQTTHLPYVRITPLGIYDVMKNEVLIPVKER
ncbi:adenine deaminase C-terminal domain-containing protein [Sporosarcina soli]|uniref:adenine deaminase n=1 Tax=Sporosarcina soli TaxID=334736 RepID=A0ABW0TUK6_9BACL